MTELLMPRECPKRLHLKISFQAKEKEHLQGNTGQSYGMYSHVWGNVRLELQKHRIQSAADSCSEESSVFK